MKKKAKQSATFQLIQVASKRNVLLTEACSVVK